MERLRAEKRRNWERKNSRANFQDLRAKSTERTGRTHPLSPANIPLT